MRKYVFVIIIIVAAVIGIQKSCTRTLKDVEIAVQDSIRHYRPIMQGDELRVVYRIANLGDEPLMLTDVLPGCGCTFEDSKNNVVMPHKETTLLFIFDSSKSVGYTQQEIYLYGNISPSKYSVLKFDVNVVRPQEAPSDYEELYWKNQDEKSKLSGAINGNTADREYYINEGDYPEDYAHHYNRYPWREKTQDE